MTHRKLLVQLLSATIKYGHEKEVEEEQEEEVEEVEEKRLTASWQIFSDLIFLGDLNVWLAGRMVD